MTRTSSFVTQKNLQYFLEKRFTRFSLVLVGGDEWKVVAESLGLTPREIRFLDNRTLNPCDAALSFIANQRPTSVGGLYDVLNDCGFPIIADLL